MGWATEVRFPGGASFQTGSEPTQSLSSGDGGRGSFPRGRGKATGS
jgi:hypothetical protein